MEFIEEFDISTFEFWGQAEDVVAGIKKAGKLAELNSLIEAVFSERLPFKVDINDFVSYERDMICEELGLEDM